MTTSINARIDSETKKEVTAILHSLGMTMSQAISVFFRQIVLTKGIPFELKIPNAETLKTFRNTDRGKDLHRVSGVEELMEELER